MNRQTEYARTLLGKAKDDAYILECLVRVSDSPAWGLGFHAQQAIEKAIKAVLAAHNINFPFTHDIPILP